LPMCSGGGTRDCFERSMGDAEEEIIVAAGREVRISHPRKVLFPRAGHTKLDLARYYVTVAEGALRGAGGRPCMLKRYPDGVGADFFYQKRAPKARPEWVEVVTLRFPSGRSADELVPRDAAALAWMANLACLELHPHPVRAQDLEHPDELRVDLDPVPGVRWPQVRDVTCLASRVLQEFGLTGWPKTSGSRGMHLLVRIQPRWSFDEVRRAALALAREVERRAAPQRHEQVVEGGAPWRVPRLQPEREGPHRGRGLFRAADRRRPRLGAARLEGSRNLRPRGVHPGDDAAALRPHRRPPPGHRPGGRLARAAAGALAQPGKRRTRRRALAAVLPQESSAYVAKTFASSYGRVTSSWS
jgi:DNA ligase D-like protein (predicted polymerase)